MNSSFKLSHAGTFFYGLLVAISLGVLLSLSASPALAQSATGTMTGQVTDQQNAVIGGAEVKVLDPTTSSTRTTTTNEVGRFTLPNIPPGSYTVTVTKTGFTSAKLQNQKVDVGEVLTLNIPLQVGSTTTTVEVQATAGAELQTLNATIGTTITNEALNLMPNLGRDASTLSVLQVGVALTGNVAGAATDQNGFMLDGVTNSDDMAGTNTTYTPGNGYSGAGATGGTPTGAMPTPIESIEEFKVGTTGQTADFSGAAGSSVQMVTKRGTNQFHGALYEFYFANDVGAANTWKNNHTLVNGPGCSTGPACDATPLPSTHRNRFGGAIGGPLTPKFWGGKTYFFANYEGMRYPNVQSFEKAVPTTLMRAGILQMNNTAGVLTPYNLNPGPVTVGGTTYQPAQCNFSGGAGPCDPRGLGLNPTISKIWNTLPMPNDFTPQVTSTTTGYADGINAAGYLTSNLSLPQSSNFIVGRIDHDFGDKWKFMSSYRYYSFSQLVSTQVDIGGVLAGASFGVPKSYAPRPVKPSFWSAGLTTAITANITNDFRFGFLRNFWQWSTQAGPPQFAGLGGVVEIGGESQTGSLIPYNVDSQDVRQRFWDGHDYNINDTVSHLHGNHLFQYGGTYLRIFDYHGRNDNGVGIDTSPTYQIAGTNISSSAYTLPVGANSSNASSYPIMFNEITGLITQTQVMYTRSGSALTLNPIGTPGFDQSIIPTYEIFGSDTWHIRPSVTITYGLNWGVSMPPYEINGKQVEMLNQSTGQPIEIQKYMEARQSAALAGQVYEPQISFATIRNINGGADKYPYNPFYGGFSPRVSIAWNPKFNSDSLLGKVFGDGKTVVRGGYARIYGRLNGVDLLLVPLLGPGLLQAVSCTVPTMTGQCGTGTPSTGFRIGADGLTAPLPGVGALASQITQSLPQPFIPGATQNGVLNTAAADGSQLDPIEKPNHSDEVNLTIQRSFGSRMLLEVGYIGRKIKNEFQEINLDAVPTMTTLGGQTFAQAYANVYQELCGGTGPVCTTPNQGAVTAQPFFEAAMGGSNSAYCAGSASCTAAVAKNEAANISTVKAYQVWIDLSSKSGWTLGKTMLAPSGTNQLSGAFDFINSLGHGNYNAGFVSFTAKDWHGLTARSNFTYGRSLGTGSVVQASSSITVPNPYDFNNFGTYGTQPFDVKYTYSLLMLYQEPWFKGQQGILGRVLGGWTIAPLFTARSGQPLRISDSTNGEGFGEIYSGQTANYEGAVGAAPFTGGNSYNYNVTKVTGSANPNGVATSGTTGLNLFNNPVAVFNEFRPPVLGLDTSTGGGFPIRGFGFWNLDATISKDFKATERIGATLTIQFVNMLNHFVPGDPGTSLASPSGFGVVTSQYTTPNGAQARWMEFGLRLRF
jgi:hypothetical protein